MDFIIWHSRLQEENGCQVEKTIYTREYAVVLRLIKDAREQSGITQVKLAEKLRQSQSFVSKIERGDRRLDIIQLRTICKIVGMTLPDFVQRLEAELAKHQ
jgi:transcriptional regulator with XRE-family HTH domain